MEQQAIDYFKSLTRQAHFLPTVGLTVAIAVIFTYIQEHREELEKKRKAARPQEEWTEEEVEEESEEEDSDSDSDSDSGSESDASDASATEEGEAKPKRKAFSLPTTPLPPPDMTTTLTAAELAKHDGSNADAPIYVAIKGSIFDVSTKKEMYGPGGNYNVFAGKDASRALGKSSVKPEDCVADYSDLDEKEQKTLSDWYTFFEKRYPIVGKTA